MEETAHQSFDFLFKEYEPDRWWFEIFVCVNRLMTTGGSVAFKEGSAIQVASGTLMAVISICVYSLYTPFIKAEDNVLAMFAQWSVFLTLFAGLMLKLNLSEQDEIDDDGSAFGWFLIAVNGLVLVVALGAFVYEAHREVLHNRKTPGRFVEMTPPQQQQQHKRTELPVEVVHNDLHSVTFDSVLSEETKGKVVL